MINKFRWKNIAIILSLLIIILYPVFFHSPYIMHIFILFFCWAIVASSWNLIYGYAGIWSLAQVGVFAIGTYSSGMIAKYIGISPFICIPLGGALAALITTVFVGLPSLRLKGIYICVFSLMFSDAIPSVLTQTRKWTGGGRGLHGIPPLWNNISRIHYYYIGFGIFLFSLFIIYKIINSSTGKAFIALRDSRNFALSLGINEYKERIKVFSISSFFAGLSGAFYGHYLGNISPTTLGISPFLLAIAMMEMGGLGRFPGAVMGALVLVFGNELLRLTGMFRLTILGAAVVLIMLFMPKGLIQIVDIVDAQISKDKKKHYNKSGKPV